MIVVDAQKRQKVMLAAVAVLALGAGSYWFLGRDSGGSQSAALSDGPIVRKEKAATDAPKSIRKKDPKAATSREEPKTVERKEREAPEETTVERKKKREEKTKEKKKTAAPAA